MEKRVIKLPEEGWHGTLEVLDSDDTEFEIDNEKVIIRTRYEAVEYDEGLACNVTKNVFSVSSFYRRGITCIDMEYMEDKGKWIVTMYSHNNKYSQVISDPETAHTFYHEMLEWAFE